MFHYRFLLLWAGSTGFLLLWAGLQPVGLPKNAETRRNLP
jgi:hypothetical protein